MTDDDALASDHRIGLGRSIYDGPPASSADLAHAERLLAKHGMIPLTDAAGHRAALHLWRDHSQREKERPLAALQTAVDAILAASRPTVNAHGKSLPAEYRWIRPADLIVTTHQDFPYHTTAAGLAELAGRLVAERGDPRGMHRILGRDLSVMSYPRLGGWAHQINVNGNHRSVAIRAAGFPVALAHVTVKENPWTLDNLRRHGNRPTDGIAYLRLLTRAGLLNQFGNHNDTHKPTAHAGQHHQWLIHGDPSAARRNLLAYENRFGPLAGVELDWIRDADELDRRITAERAAMARICRPLTHYDLAEVVGQPLPQPGRLELRIARLRRRLSP